MWLAGQYERSLDAYKRLTSATDAKGRKLEVIKVPVPPPLFRTYKEASGVHVSPLTRPPPPSPLSHFLPPFPRSQGRLEGTEGETEIV